MLLASRCRSAPLCPAEVLPARMTQHALAHAQEVAKSCVSEVVTRNQEALDQQSLIHEALLHDCLHVWKQTCDWSSASF